MSLPTRFSPNTSLNKVRWKRYWLEDLLFAGRDVETGLAKICMSFTVAQILGDMWSFLL